MNKLKAISLLGGTRAQAAAAIGVTKQSVSQWPDVLPRRIADRVQAALWRANNPPADAREKPASGHANSLVDADEVCNGCGRSASKKEGMRDEPAVIA